MLYEDITKILTSRLAEIILQIIEIQNIILIFSKKKNKIGIIFIVKRRGEERVGEVDTLRGERNISTTEED